MASILAIDPGIAFVGIALLDDGQPMSMSTIRLGGGLEPEERIQRLRQDFTSYVSDLPVMPDSVVIEGFAMYGMKAAVINAFQMGRVVQCIADILYSLGLPTPIAIPAREARKFITGNGNAKSAQIKAGLSLMGYNLKSNEHERDALALALYREDIEKEDQGEDKIQRARSGEE